jgi:hypothetical protein
VSRQIDGRHAVVGLARAFAGAIIFALSLLMTMEMWWLGRQLKLRIHLGALLLQWLYDLTDRQVDWAIKDNAAYQLFCGCGIV